MASLLLLLLLLFLLLLLLGCQESEGRAAIVFDSSDLNLKLLAQKDSAGGKGVRLPKFEAPRASPKDGDEGDYHRLMRQRRETGHHTPKNVTRPSLTLILDRILTNYDKRIRPEYLVPNAERRPTRVGVSMWVSSVSSISEVNMDFTLDMYFRQRWRDSRLAFHEYIEGIEDEVEESVSVAEEMLTRIWWPDTFFVNAKKADFHHATTRNAFLRIDSNGNILHSLRITVTAMCPMDLTYFPMDSQTCSLEVESFGYTTKDILYYWLEEAVGIDKGVKLPQYEVRGKREREKLIMLSTGFASQQRQISDQERQNQLKSGSCSSTAANTVQLRHLQFINGVFS